MSRQDTLDQGIRPDELPSEKGVWYAAEFLGDGLIRLVTDIPRSASRRSHHLKTGNGYLSCSSFTRIIPKVYRTRDIDSRLFTPSEEYILTRSVDHDPTRFVLIYDIDAAWLSERFNIEISSRDDPANWLDKEYRSVKYDSSSPNRRMESQHWSEDTYWTEALERFYQRREEGRTQITLDLNVIEDAAFDEDGPAYKLMQAMCSVREQEGMDSYRGAPRVLLALLIRLEELAKNRGRQ